MTIGLVAKPDRQMTGMLRYALSIYKALKANGMDVDLIHTNPPLNGLMARAGRMTGLDPQAFFATYPLNVRLKNASICHLASQNLATLLFFRRLPPTVVTVLDIIPHLVQDDEELTTYRHSFDRLFDRLSLRALQRADALIAISEFTKKTVVDAFGYPADRIHVIYLAVDTGLFKPLKIPAGFHQKYGLDEDCQHILYVGSEDPRKNLATLIQAFATVQTQLPDARLVKAGSAHFDTERKRLRSLVRELGIENKVIFLDHVPDRDLPLLYNLADIFVLPSYYEGFGLPALEAMSCGTPVIASNRTSLPEVVGDAGILLDPGDEWAIAREIIRLLKETEYRKNAAETALGQSQRFSLERQATETMTVYEELRSNE